MEERDKTYPARMGEEMGANWLDVAVGRMTEVSGGFEVLLSSPARGQDGEGQIDLYRCRRHGGGCGVVKERLAKDLFRPH